jgi:hypothetical protein
MRICSTTFSPRHSRPDRESTKVYPTIFALHVGFQPALERRSGGRTPLLSQQVILTKVRIHHEHPNINVFQVGFQPALE